MDGVAAGGMFTKWVGFRWADDGWAPRELVLGCVAVATFFFKNSVGTGPVLYFHFSFRIRRGRGRGPPPNQKMVTKPGKHERFKMIPNAHSSSENLAQSI